MSSYASGLCNLLVQICQLILQTTPKRGIWVAVLPATSRHTRHKLWLLPSGPDQVRLLVLREDQ